MSECGTFPERENGAEGANRDIITVFGRKRKPDCALILPVFDPGRKRENRLDAGGTAVVR